MARCEVIQVRCDRCKRVELRPPAPPRAAPDLRLIFLGKELVYEDLCMGCKDPVGRAIVVIQEWEREVKQQFGPNVPSNQAPPLVAAPNYAPPIPHAAGAKR